MFGVDFVRPVILRSVSLTVFSPAHPRFPSLFVCREREREVAIEQGVIFLALPLLYQYTYYTYLSN